MVEVVVKLRLYLYQKQQRLPMMKLKSGDIIVFPSTDKTPDGLLLKVVSVEKVNGKTEVRTEPASLTDAIENADIQQNIDLTVMISKR